METDSGLAATVRDDSILSRYTVVGCGWNMIRIRTADWSSQASATSQGNILAAAPGASSQYTVLYNQ